MPRIKRWHPVSHDFNHDPEVLELRVKFGDWMAFVWLEMLSISDRNEGEIHGDLDYIARSLVRVSTGNSKRYNTEWKRNEIRMTFEWMSDKGWIDIEQDSIQISKHLKYHRTEERKKVPPRPDLTRPDLIQTSAPKSAPSEGFLSVQDLVDTWNANYADKLAKVVWPLSKSRHRKALLRVTEHKTEEFWHRVFDNIHSSAFLMGTGNGNWRCTLDFLIANDTNVIKIYEGAYNGKQAR